MKRTKTRLLTLLLVLTMVIGMLPLAVLSVAAQGTVDSISVDEDGAINDLDWNPGYMLSETAPGGDELWTIVTGSWEQAYYYTDIVRIPTAGTTLIWSEPVSLGEGDVPMLMGEDYCFVTSWKETADNAWEINKVGANIKSAAHYTYDAATQTVIYTYTTTQDNEALRFGCYGGQADGSVASNPDECPRVYAFTPSFNAEEGIVENVKWLGGYVGSYLDAQGFANAICYGAEGYAYSAPIMVPKAGTTILFNAAASTSDIYAFSAWRVAGDGRLEMIYGCPGGDSNSAWLTVDAQNGSYTYTYTTSYDNEVIRLSCSNSVEEAPVVRYVENNESEIAPTLKAAGYDPAINGVPYMLSWHNGRIVDDGIRDAANEDSYAYSDALTVYGKGTKVTFVDASVNAQVGADEFIVSDGALAFGKFSSANDTDTILDSVAGLTQAEREAAAAAGKKVFTYTTTEDKEYLRMTIAKKGNMINGYLVAPIVYVGGNDSSYSALNGKTIVALGDDNLRGGNIGDANTWLSLLAGRYDMNYYNYSINGSILTDVEIGAPCVAESYENMVDNADVVVLAAGKNDYLNKENPNMVLGDPSSDDPTVYYGAVKAVVDGLMGKYPDAVIVCVAAWEEDSYVEALASYAESLNSNRVCVIRPYDQMSAFMQDDVLVQECNGIKLPNVMGNRLVLPLFEKMIGDTYLNYHGQGVKFTVGETVVDAHGTSVQDVEMIAPKPTDAVCAENMFGWYGIVTNGDTTKTMLIKVGEKVTFTRGDVAVFEPLTLDIKQDCDPTLRIVDDTIGGIRFLSGVSKAGYTQLLDMIKGGALANASISFGTLIAAQNDVSQMDGGLTHKALAGNTDIQDVPFVLALDAKGNAVWYRENDERGYISGTITEIDPSENGVDFISAGYVKLTFNGKDYYAYADNLDKQGCSIYELAIDALNDVSEVRDDSHKLQIAKDQYSAYSIADRKMLRNFVDNVVALETLENGAIDFVKYDNYDPNGQWEITAYTMQTAAGIWSILVDQLGDPGVSTIYRIASVDGATPYATGGILLDGVMLDCQAIEYAGSTYYLIGSSDYTPIQ